MTRDPNSDGDGSNYLTSRRAVLAIFSIGAVGAYVGRDELESLLMGNSNGKDPEANTPDQEDRRETELTTFQNTHQNALSNLNDPANNYRFDYESVDFNEQVDDGETLSILASPAPDRPGDRLAVSLPESGRDPDALAERLVRSWGAKSDQTMITVDLFGGRVEFNGGSGVEIAAAASVGSMPELGRSAMIVRGESPDNVRELAKEYEQLTQ